MAEPTVTVHRFDDVVVTVDLVEFLDEIGEVDVELQTRLNAELEAYVEENSEFYGETWYNLFAERDSGKVLRLALAKTLDVDPDDPYPLYGFCTANWDNVLSDDFGGTLWGTSEGLFLTVESDGFGMNKTVELRPVSCSEPVVVIAAGSSHIRLGCTSCTFHLETTHHVVDWEQLTRPDPDPSFSDVPRDGLFCPICGQPVVAELLI